MLCLEPHVMPFKSLSFFPFLHSWEGVKDPSEDDWIAVYLAESDPTVTAPVQYIHANVSQSHMSSGSGSAR